ncbi:MAG TPA: APC family permease [Dehalococcoidia bacterium]|nr:APC family permease [Dehalococcoidia bacterium]
MTEERQPDGHEPAGADPARGPQDAPPESSRVRIERRRTQIPEVERTELVHGAKPGSRYARRVRAGERRFERIEEEGTIRATERATAPRTPAQQFWRNVRKVALGSPIASEAAEEQRLPKVKALAVFSSDALSSSAYATDEILLVLAAATTGALSASIPIALAIGVLLAIVAFSYRQTIRAYPSGGGSYIVARENLGDVAGLSAAAALSVDYILTVSVSIAAGVFAITSAAPGLHPISVELAVGFVSVITLLNLRGIRESGTIFAVPTYLFIFAFIMLLVGGFVRWGAGPAHEPSSGWHPIEGGNLTWFLVLRAFASGCAALTGVEAISNGIPAFKKPESRNASTTLMWMVVILGTFFIGLTILAHHFGVQHADKISAPAQVARVVYGHTPVFYYIQIATALILILAANTSYADFPRLGSILARDRFLPHQFTFRGDRLAFSNGIIVLGVVASALLVVFDADVDRLIPLYAFGVFVSFTLSQGGMVVHWLRLKETGWKGSMVVNGVGATATAIVAVIIGATKFSEGAWISMIAMVILALFFYAIHRHYSGVRKKLELPPDVILDAAKRHRQAALVPVDEINRAVLRTVDYARTISPNVTALHVTDDVEAGRALREEWERTVLDVPMVVIDSPYRSFVAPVLSYIEALDRADPGQYVTVVLPEFVTAWPWQRWLHNQSARRLRNALLERPNTVLVEVPYHLASPAPQEIESVS